MLKNTKNVFQHHFRFKQNYFETYRGGKQKLNYSKNKSKRKILEKVSKNVVMYYWMKISNQIS